ncbi:MAG: nucleoside recognition domain-containing protein [Myxococcota bacterium]|nr:nucleoside recognition domain-containing protein [Myxococcota bacterium]
MLNWIWLALIVIAVLYGGWNGVLVPGPDPDASPGVTQAIGNYATAAVTLVIGLVGFMVFWLGVMRVAFDGGLRALIGRVISPLTRRLFPDVPGDHPAMGAMVMNMSSNILGMGNAATPFGLKAMKELGRINPLPGIASDSMVLFLAINTSAITLLPPLGTIAIRLAAGSADPFEIWVPTLIATTCSTIGAVSAFFALRGLPVFSLDRAAAPLELEPELEIEGGDEIEIEGDAPVRSFDPTRASITAVVLIALFVVMARDMARVDATTGAAYVQHLAQAWLIPLLLLGLLLYGFAKGVNVYESAIAGAREGLDVAVRIVPYLVIILAAIGMLRESGAIDAVSRALDPYTSAIGVPAEVLPMAILRPLSGSGSFAIMNDIVTTHGPDSFVGRLTCTLMGSTETTFYVLAVYLGAAGIRSGRHVLLACLAGDLCGFAGAVAACHWWFG